MKMPSSGARLKSVDATRKALRPGGVAKRAVDIAGSGILLVLFSPLIAILAMVIKLEDGGPVIHRRRVIGLNGEFDAFKLRTMRTDADKMLEEDESLRAEFEVNFKLKRDPRVTRVGGVLRKLSLDELPQLWNVLCGQMSLVGPRMITSAELPRFGEAAWIFEVVKPGLTGYWQIAGRQEVSYEERVAMEMYYLENQSFWFDMKIVLKTPLKVLKGVGAY